MPNLSYLQIVCVQLKICLKIALYNIPLNIPLSNWPLQHRLKKALETTYSTTANYHKFKNHFQETRVKKSKQTRQIKEPVASKHLDRKCFESKTSTHFLGNTFRNIFFGIPLIVLKSRNWIGNCQPLKV